MTEFDFKAAIETVAQEDKEIKSQTLNISNALDALAGSINMIETSILANNLNKNKDF